MKFQLEVKGLPYQTRISLAKETIDPAVIEAFVDDPEPEVRMMAAGNPAATAETVEKYSRDPSPYVRAAAAGNHKADDKTLLRLVVDDYFLVKDAVEANIKERIKEGRL